MNAVDQIKKDTETWVPVAFFSYFIENGEPILHQLWCSALGNTRWEKIETRDIREMTRVYAECQVYGDNTRPEDDLEI